MRHAITLEAIRVLDAIDRKGSFGAAAQSLFKVPSALSYTIQKLESELNTALFDRSKQKAQLTPAGKFLLTQGRALLESASAIEEAVKQLESGWELKLKISLDALLPTQPFFALLNRFLQLDRQVEIEYHEEVLGGTWDALINDRSDLALGASGEPPKTQLECISLGEVKFVFAVAKDHPLCRVEEEIQPAHLKEYPAIVGSDSSLTSPAKSSGLFQSKQIIRVPNMAAKIEAHKLGLGVGFVPRHLVADELKTGSLVELPCSIPRPKVPIYAAWKNNKNIGKALTWFTQTIKQDPQLFTNMLHNN